MKHSALRSHILVFALVLAAACAGDRLRRQGEKAFEAGAYEEAVASLEQAVKQDPDNLELRLELRVRREAAVQALVSSADTARTNGLR